MKTAYEAACERLAKSQLMAQTETEDRQARAAQVCQEKTECDRQPSQPATDTSPDISEKGDVGLKVSNPPNAQHEVWPVNRRETQGEQVRRIIAERKARREAEERAAAAWKAAAPERERAERKRLEEERIREEEERRANEAHKKWIAANSKCSRCGRPIIPRPENFLDGRAYGPDCIVAARLYKDSPWWVKLLTLGKS